MNRGFSCKWQIKNRDISIAYIYLQNVKQYKCAFSDEESVKPVSSDSVVCGVQDKSDSATPAATDDKCRYDV